MSFNNFYKIVLLIIIIFQISSDKIDYGYSSISDMHTSFFNTKSEKIYYVGNLIKNYTIIGFSDLNNDKYTDIISYQKDEKNYFSFYVHYYDDDKPGFKSPVRIFNFSLNNIKNENFLDKNFDDFDVRNLYVGAFLEKKAKRYCFIITFENQTLSNHDLLHYIICQKQEEGEAFNFTSNILILNRDEDKNLRILFSDIDNISGSANKNSSTIICKLPEEIGKKCEYENFENYLIADEKRDKDHHIIIPHEKNYEYINYLSAPLSLSGGLAYIDLTGNCIPDIILSHDHNDSLRTIEVYIANKTNKFILKDVIKLNLSDSGEKYKYGAFAISRVNDNRDGSRAPMFDLLIPRINSSSSEIIYFENKIKIKYKWSNYFCDAYANEYKTGDIISVFEDDIEKNKIYKLNLEIDEFKDKNPKIKLDLSFPTVIRVGDFLSSSNPGIICKQIVEIDGEEYSYISLYERKNRNFQHYASFELSKIDKNNDDDEFEKGLFFDIDEAGSLSMILTTKKKNNYFFFNYQRNNYFIKSKLMNDEDLYYDINLGSSFRYIVTDKDGDRHMDAYFQLAQTSDMNIPLPYSLIGLDDTNNYVEYFETQSGNFLEKSQKVDFEKSDEENYKGNSPIIPNTQMMISKYYKSNRKTIEWNVDLIVQPMEQIWLFFIIVVIVLLIVLCIIIYLHIKEVKEEQKETTKFKSWFA